MGKESSGHDGMTGAANAYGRKYGITRKAEEGPRNVTDHAGTTNGSWLIWREEEGDEIHLQIRFEIVWHRKHPGGRGLAGGMHHHRINMDMYHPGYFGKVGMRHFHLTHQQYWAPVVNIDKLWSLVPAEAREKVAANPTGPVPVIDVLRHGYAKVLGKGRLPKVPFIVKARFVSRKAEEKIVKAGGKVELVA
ncbi:60S ribosomal protein L28 [Borealophlyctis nickersoniae]|nr:60S ribosomal protein L28 [Borealophlyctis nickersoniae]